MKAEIKITRIVEGSKQTLGHGVLFINNIPVFTFVTLELPNLHNQTNVSSIPALKYLGAVITRPSGKKAVLINDVPGRSAILIHIGNYFSDIQGCIIVGKYFKDINSDGFVDVAESTATMDELLLRLEECTQIEISVIKAVA